MSEERPVRPSHYVGIGASAGGLEAIDGFFKHMPPDSGCAFIVVQHLSPDHKSLMAELLSKRSTMPVSRAEDGKPVEANHVYLIPPNYDMRIFHGKLVLTEQNRHGGLNLPIDIFLNSLAEDQGDKSVAIILSGTGSDGTRGLRAIKEKNGLIMVQSVETAVFDGMPRSAMAGGLVDYVLAPEEMPAQLIAYLQHPYANKRKGAEPLLSDEDGLNRIFSFLREKTGIDFTYYKPTTLVRRIERRMSVNQLVSLNEYVRYLESYPREIDSLHRDLLIGVTNFFRDPDAFRELQTRLLPDLLSQARDKPIRFWVAGCSTGEEAYSLAILCHEVMEKTGKLAEIKIFATDVDKEAIAWAARGIYPESISADVPQSLLTRFFYRREDGFQIARHVREMVVFAQHNLIKDPPFTNIELISCRNLLIYLQPVLQKRVMELFNFSLNTDGILFLGASETTGEMGEFFDPLSQKWKLYRSRGHKRREALSEQATTFNMAGRMQKTMISTPRGYPLNLHEEERLIERFLQKVSGEYLPFAMVLSENLELLHIIGEPNEYLRIPTGRVQTDVGKMVHPDLAIPISTGLQRVFKGQDEVRYNNIYLRNREGQSKAVNMRIAKLPQKKGQSALFVVLVEASSRQRVGAGSVDADEHVTTYDLGREAEQRIYDLEQELQFTRESLQATVEELETSNEELQATNEELLASNEELQSTNEELQSVNEELFTVNAEHQSKITELTEVNNDLDNLLANTQIATLFLDQNLEIRRFTREISRFVRIIDQDIGRPFHHFSHDLQDIDLDHLIQQVLATHQPIEKEVSNLGGHSYLLRIYPYRIGPEVYSGVLMTLVNIDTAKKVEEELKISQERYMLAQRAAHMGSWFWNLEKGELIWSESIEGLFGMKPGEFDGSYEGFLRLIPADDRLRVQQEVAKSLSDPSLNYAVEHRIIWPDNSVRWMEEHGQVHVDERGKPVSMVGIVQDITEKKSAELTKELSELMFRETMNKLDDIYLQLDRHGEVLFANKFFCQLTGWSIFELTGKSFIDHCIPEGHRADVRKVFRAYAGGGGKMHGEYDNPMLKKNGETIMIHWKNTPVTDAEGNPVGVSTIGFPVKS